MLLSMDKKGRIYQAAAHRPDGKGFETLPTISGTGDVNLDSSALKAEVERGHYNKLQDVFNANENLNTEVRKRQMGYARMLQANAQKKQASLITNPLVQNKLLNEAVLQNFHGADFDQLDWVTGYGKSATGQRGMSGQDRAIEAALMQGMGEASYSSGEMISSVDAIEAEQYQLSLAAKDIKANLQSALVAQAEPIAVNPPLSSVQAALPPTYAPIANAVTSTSNSFFAKATMQDYLKWGVIGFIAYKIFSRK